MKKFFKKVFEMLYAAILIIGFIAAFGGAWGIFYLLFHDVLRLD